MEKTYQQIVNGELPLKTPKVKVRKIVEENIRKQKWYEIGKAIKQGFDVKMHKESKRVARRTFHYYHYYKGNWKGPSARKLSKMNQVEFERVMEEHMGLELLVLPSEEPSDFNLDMIIEKISP